MWCECSTRCLFVIYLILSGKLLVEKIGNYWFQGKTAFIYLYIHACQLYEVLQHIFYLYIIFFVCLTISLLFTFSFFFFLFGFVAIYQKKINVTCLRLLELCFIVVQFFFFFQNYSTSFPGTSVLKFLCRDCSN